MARYLALFFFLTGCFSDLGTPEDGLTSCGSDSDCLSPQVCAEFGRCVEPGTDTSAIRLLGEVMLDSTTARAGSEVVTRFSTNREPSVPPEVVLEGAGFTLPMAQRSFDAASGEYVYIAQVVEAQLPDGGSGRVRVVLADAFSTTVTAVSLTGVIFDFSPPSVVPESTLVSLTPTGSNPREAVTMVTAGTEISVSVQVDEVVSTASLALAGTQTSFTSRSALGAILVFDLTLSQAVTSGTYGLELSLTDTAGNSGTTPLGTVVVDQDAPEAPGVDLTGAVIHRREPWGSTQNPEPYAEVRGVSGAAEADAWIRVFGDPGGSSLLGAQDAGPDGSFNVPLTLATNDRVFIQAVDAAGNRSPIVQVRDGEWVATFNGADGNTSDSNPHRASASRHNSNFRPFNDPRTEPFSSADLASLWTEDSIGARVDFAGAWSRIEVSSEGVPLGNLGAAYDRVRQETIVFGGTSSVLFGSVSQATWRYANGALNQVNPAGQSPAARAGHTMAYDSRSGILLFGGLASAGVTVNDTWVWAGDRWVELSPTDAPPPRFLHGMAHDAARGVTVVYGGCADVRCRGIYSDLWEWDGVSWREVTQSGTRPGAVAAHAMAPHPLGVVLHGGCGGRFQTDLGLECESVDGTDIQKTFLWDGATWSELAGIGADERMFHQLLSIDDELLIVGGCYFENQDGEACFSREETWCRNDESGWFQVSNDNDEAESAVTIYHEVDQEIVSFGGFSRNAMSFTSTVQLNRRRAPWDGSCEDSEWLDTTSSDPGPAVRDSILFDRATRRLALYTDSAYLFDPEKGTWTRTSAGDPPARSNYAFTYDFETNRGILTGGDEPSSSIFRTFVYNPTTLFGSWSEVCTTSFCRNGLGRRFFHASTYDIDIGQTLIFGGVSSASSSTVNSQLWGYNGVQWVPRCTSCTPRPTSGYCSSMTFDEARNVTLLFGGSTENNQSECESPPFDLSGSELPDTLWQWNGSGWTRLCGLDAGNSCSGPTGRIGHVLTYHPRLARTFLIGGGDEDIWAWNGTAWSLVEVVGERPSGRFTPAATAAEEGPIYVYGGRIGDENAEDFWRLDLNARPGVRLAFDWRSSGLAKAQIQGLEILIVGGARGYTIDTSLGADGDTDGEPEAGIALRVFSTRNGRFGAEEGTAQLNWSADTESPEGARLAADDPATVGDWLSDVTGTLDLDLSPLSPSGNGPEPGSVALDYAELVLRYRL